MKKTLVLILLIVVQQAIAQPSDKTIKIYHQFDFWLGHWDVYKFGTDTLVGESRIESIIDSVALLENYSSVRGKYSGKSLNKYNPAKKRWEQYWVDSSGLTLYLSGRIVDRKMVLDDVATSNPGKGLNKIVWEKLDGNRVRQTWSVSGDNGKTWKVVFDGEYKPSVH